MLKSFYLRKRLYICLLTLNLFKMKKLILLFVLFATISCSNDDQIESADSAVSDLSSSVFDGKMLSFKNYESFINEYSEISEMKTSKDIQSWISKKGHESLLNNDEDSDLNLQEMEQDVVLDSRTIYSDGLKALLNTDSKFKIGSKVLWLYDRNFYVLEKNDVDKKAQDLIMLKNDLEVYGKLLNYSDSGKRADLTSRDVIPNENRSKTYVVGLPNDRRYVLDLFNETIVINGQISSSRMYLRYTLQYKSCSFWRCTWKQDTTTPWHIYGSSLTSTVGGEYGPWFFSGLDTNTLMYGQKTFLLASWGTRVPYLPSYVNFNVSGSIEWKYASTSATYPQQISWY